MMQLLDSKVNGKEHNLNYLFRGLTIGAVQSFKS